MSEIAARRAPGTIDEGLATFEQALLSFIADHGLPVGDVFVALPERGRAFRNFGDVLDQLPQQHRQQAFYLAKMVAATAAGLFDAALNYLWDETIVELRRRVERYDLSYFYDLAVPAPEKRRQLKSFEDISLVQDIDLLRACEDMGLITSLGHHQLDHIRYLRNHASAAHPNHNELTGLQLVTLLETCIREVISQPFDEITAHAGQLLRNIKGERMSTGAITATASFFTELSDSRADSLATGLFGIYVAPESTPEAPDNVRSLWPLLWPYVSENERSKFGYKYGRYVADANHAQAGKARELLDLVDAQSYLPEPIREVAIDGALDDLLSAHRGWNNFHTEPLPARRLEELVGERGKVPKRLNLKYVQTIVEAYLTNGVGVAWAAQPVYERLVESFSPTQAGIALRSYRDPTISSRLQTATARAQWEMLLKKIEPKLTDSLDRKLHKAILSSSRNPDDLDKDPDVRLHNPLPLKNERKRT